MDKDRLDFGGEKGIHLVHFNARSLRDIKKWKILKYHIKESEAQVIWVSESWLKEEIPGEDTGIQFIQTG